jgi:hypothetical protein
MLKLQQLIRENWVRGLGGSKLGWRVQGWDVGSGCSAGRGVGAWFDGTPHHITPPLQDDLAKMVTQEQGKTFQDARGDVFRGLGEPQHQQGCVLQSMRCAPGGAGGQALGGGGLVPLPHICGLGWSQGLSSISANTCPPTTSCPRIAPSEVVEAAAGIAPLLMGETVENVAAGIDCYSYRQPLGVSDISVRSSHEELDRSCRGKVTAQPLPLARGAVGWRCGGQPCSPRPALTAPFPNRCALASAPSTSRPWCPCGCSLWR